MKKRTSGKAFFNTNVLIYAVTESGPQSEQARVLMAGGGTVSVHVLNEFVAVARRKLKRSWEDISIALSRFELLCPDPSATTIKTHELALGLAQRYGYQIYDCLVIAAALESSCNTLFSEDMGDGHKIQSLTIRNPFRGLVSGTEIHTH